MAVVFRKTVPYLYGKPFRHLKKVGLSLPLSGTEAQMRSEALILESVLLKACAEMQFARLDDAAREVCVRLFQALNLEIPEDLDPVAPVMAPRETLTLWKSCELFLKYPGIYGTSGIWRYEIGISHLVEHFGKDMPLRSIWVPELKQYQVTRQQQGAAPDTINRELSTLSRLFSVLIELRLIEGDGNPCRQLTRLSTKSGERQVYLSKQTIEEIAAKTPAWFRPILWAAYFTGMRRGELLALTRKQLNLESRVIVISPEGTKEGAWKRIPVHKDLVPILRKVLEGPVLMSGKVFPLREGNEVSELGVETFKNVWPRACEALGMPEPLPRFHDLRHTWKTNARRSKMDPEIRESILGHSTRQRSVSERYGRISDKELLEAIDGMTFDHGETEILVSSHRNGRPHQRAEQQASNIFDTKKKKPRCYVA